jgi:hypothetical protein
MSENPFKKWSYSTQLSVEFFDDDSPYNPVHGVRIITPNSGDVIIFEYSPLSDHYCCSTPYYIMKDLT